MHPMQVKIGDKFGLLEVVDIYPNKYNKGWILKCTCKCGKVKEYPQSILVKKHRNNCGCKKIRPEAIIGKKFNKLLVLSISGIKKGIGTIVETICECGNKKQVIWHKLINNRVKSCGCLRKKEKKISISIEQIKSSLINTLISRYKYNAKKRNLNFSLSKEDCVKLFENKCFYCLTNPNQQIISRSKYYPYIFVYNGIDRKNPKIGYSIDNCVSCCGKCNFMKSDMTIEEFLEQNNLIYKNFNE